MIFNVVPSTVASTSRRSALFLGQAPVVFHGAVFAVSLAILSWLHIVLGELVPRTLGIQFAETVALWGILPLMGFKTFLRWPVRFLSASSRSILRVFRVKPASEADQHRTNHAAHIELFQ